MTTALDLITQALKACGVLGVGQVALAEDQNDAFVSMKQMVSQWQRRRWLVPALTEVVRVGNNAISNPIGNGQYYDFPRPDKIQGAYVRLYGSADIIFSNDFNNDFQLVVSTPSNAVDYDLRWIESYENYKQLCLKGLNSFPYLFFYDGAYPVGNVFIWPIPNQTYEIHLLVKTDLGQLPTISSDILLPPEYEEAIWTNLAIRLCTYYQISASKELAALAKVSLNTIRNANTQIPTLQMPVGIRKGPWYNIFSDV